MPTLEQLEQGLGSLEDLAGALLGRVALLEAAGAGDQMVPNEQRVNSAGRVEQGQGERLKLYGEIEGAFTPDWSEGNAIEAVMKGATTFEKPSNLPSEPGWMNVTLMQGAAGHPLTIGPGIEMPYGEPIWAEGPLATNQFSLWTDGLGTVWMFTGPEGKQGKEGPKGANGETVGAIEALLGETWPVVNGNAKATSTKPAVAWRMQRNLVVVPSKGKKLSLQWTPGAIKGKVRVIIFDTGQKVPTKESVLADTEAFINPGVEKVPGVLCELERKEGEWQAGEAVMVGIIPESAELVFPIGTEPSVGASCQYPVGHAPKGVALAKAWESDQLVLTEATAREVPFKAISEETPVAPAYTVAYRVLFS